MFIDKIKSKFREQFPNVNFSKQRLEALAEKVNGLIKEESEIETLLTSIDTVQPFAETARLDDVERNAKSKKTEVTPEVTLENDGKSELAQLLEKFNSLESKLNEVQTTSVKDKRLSAFNKSIKSLTKEQQDIRLKNFNRMNFENDEDFNDYITDTTTEVNAIVQAEKDSSSSNYKPQGAGEPTNVTAKDLEKATAVVEGMNF